MVTKLLFYVAAFLGLSVLIKAGSYGYQYPYATYQQPALYKTGGFGHQYNYGTYHFPVPHHVQQPIIHYITHASLPVVHGGWSGFGYSGLGLGYHGGLIGGNADLIWLVVIVIVIVYLANENNN